MKQKIRAWISFYQCSLYPSVHFEKPTKKGERAMKSYGVEIYKCEITYSTPSGKRKLK